MYLDLGNTFKQKHRRSDVPLFFVQVYLLITLPVGISLITQTLYAAVFCTRYLDLFYNEVAKSTLWNFVLKIFYILSSLYIIFLMMRVYARTREREKAWKLGAICMGGAVVAAPFVTFFAHHWADSAIYEVRNPARIESVS